MITQQSFAFPTDCVPLLAFVQPASSWQRHIVDLPYRLAAPAAQIPANTSIWRRDNGEIAGFAIIQRQFWTVDYGTADEDATIFGMITAWVDERMRVIAPAEHDAYPTGIRNFFGCYADDAVRSQWLLAADYALYPQWTQTHRWQSLTSAPESRALPIGLNLRTFDASIDCEAAAGLQRIAFDSTNMTAGWRARLPRVPNYVPDLDLVVTNAVGEMVAFCLGWQMGDQGQIEPIAVHPAYQRQGIGRALLQTCLRRMWERGVRIAHIEHDATEGAAAELYMSTGFAHPRLIHTYMRLWVGA